MCHFSLQYVLLDDFICLMYECVCVCVCKSKLMLYVCVWNVLCDKDLFSVWNVLCVLYIIYMTYIERGREKVCVDCPTIITKNRLTQTLATIKSASPLDNVYISGWVFFFRLPVPPDNRSFNDVIGLIFVTRSVPQPVPPSRWATHTHRWGPAIQSMSKMASWVYHLRLSRVYVRLTIHPFSHPIISVRSPLMFCTGVEGNWMATGDRGAAQ